ncbi:MAG: 3-isopropylmalate dehydratase large subunit [Kiritimatiellae bacterium]|nr:3-isopropylmalate dehydratase large subunit [Kiritimatiellia bacterium]
MTMTEKILAKHAGLDSVKPGDNIWVNVDILLTHDVCGPGTIGIFHREFGDDAKVFDKEGVVIIPDHYIFTADEKAHRNVDTLREFVKEQDLPYFYEPGTPNYCGVCHLGLPQHGHVRPGEVIVGTDSHTCSHGALGAFSTGIGNTDAGFVMGTGKMLVKVPETIRFVLNGKKPDYVSAKDMILRIIGDIGVDGATYCAMEFTGEAVDALTIDERITICNMAVEAGAKNGIIPPNQMTLDYVKARTGKEFTPVYGDPDAPVLKEYVYDVSTFVPCVAKPHIPSNYAPARDCTDIKLDRSYIGSCTGGKLEDFVMAASILKGRKVCIDTFIVPATTEIAEKLLTTEIDGKSLVTIFAEAGCLPVAPPSCAACLGGPIDTFGRTHGKEVVISTTNRNFIGRMGSKEAPIYLASPLTAAASAVKGYICDPRDL